MFYYSLQLATYVFVWLTRCWEQELTSRRSIIFTPIFRLNGSTLQFWPLGSQSSNSMATLPDRRASDTMRGTASTSELTNRLNYSRSPYVNITSLFVLSLLNAQLTFSRFVVICTIPLHGRCGMQKLSPKLRDSIGSFF